MRLRPIFRRLVLVSLCCLFLLTVCYPAPASSEASPVAQIDNLAHNGGIALVRGDQVLYEKNMDQPFMPASTLKIATALMALETLGPGYRFRTEFFLDDANILYIKGYGDPLLVSGEVERICAALAKSGVARVNGIALDDTAFELSNDAKNGRGTSLNPYDAANSALAVNFNSVQAEVKKGKVARSAEPETPTLPFMRELTAKGLADGVNRFNISEHKDATWLYVGELFREFLGRQKVAIAGSVFRRATPKEARLILRHKNSRDLQEICRGMFLYSNNFTANQLFLTAGARVHGYPATWDKARLAMREFLAKQLGLTEKEAFVEEGSGLSRENRLTARAMLKVLDRFSPYAELLAEENGYRLKSGTLKGVYSYAGYQDLDGKQPASVVIMLNQPENSRDLVLSRLDEILRQAAKP